MYKYVYARSNSSHKTKYETLEEALDRGCRDLAAGRPTPIKIEKDGVVLLSYEYLIEILQSMNEAQRIRDERDAAKRKKYRKIWKKEE
jgi:hypothetical protein